MYRLSPDRERTAIKRRTLLMGGFAGAINYAVPPVARAATAFVLPNCSSQPTLLRSVEGHQDRYTYDFIFIGNR